MPTAQHYEVEVEVIVRVHNVSASRVGGAEKVVEYSTAVVEKADSYAPNTIPAATTRAIDELHGKVSQIVRIAKDHETKRLS